MSDKIGDSKKEADRRKNPEKKKAEQKIVDAHLITIQFLFDNLIKFMVLNPAESKKAMIIREAMNVLILEEGRMRRIMDESVEYIDILCASMIKKKPTQKNVNFLRGTYNGWIEALNKNEPSWRRIEPVKLF